MTLLPAYFKKNPLVRTFYGNSLIQKLKVYKKDLNTDKDTISIISGHNGYQKKYNTMYERKIVIHENENKLTGEELVIVAKKIWLSKFFSSISCHS